MNYTRKTINLAFRTVEIFGQIKYHIVKLVSLSILLIFICAFSLPIDTQVVEWETTTDHDFGDLLRGESVTFDFKFKNISDQPIMIDNVRPDCGCTAPNWENIPTMPDSTGILSITFDATKKGYFNKKIKVFFSGQRKGEKLTVEGFVEEE